MPRPQMRKRCAPANSLRPGSLGAGPEGRGIGGVPVVDDKGKPIGIISRSDVLRHSGDVVGILSALDLLRWFSRRSGYLIPQRHVRR
jgi:hypothetical protein